MKKISVTVLFGFFCLSMLASVKTSTFKDKSFSLNGPQYILNQSDSLALECIRLGMYFSTLGLYEEANEQLWAAIDIYSEQNNMTGVLWCQEEIANNLAYLGKSEETIALGEKNLAICEKLYGKNSVRYFNALNNMAAFYGYAGDLRRSMEYRYIVLDSCKDEFQIANAKEGLATALASLGDYNTAISYYYDAYDFFSDQDDKLRVSNILHNIAGTFSEIPNLLNAVRYELDAMSVFEDYWKSEIGDSESLKINPRYNIFKHMLAAYYARLQVYDVAIGLEEEVIQWIKVVNGENSRNYIEGLSSLANMYKKDGKTEKWKEDIRSAYELCKEFQSENVKCFCDIISYLLSVEDEEENLSMIEELVKEKNDLCKKYLLYSFSGMSNDNREALWRSYSDWFESSIPYLAIKYDSEYLNGEMYNSLLFYKGLMLYSSKNVRSILENSKDDRVRSLYSRFKSLSHEIQSLQDNNADIRVVDSLRVVLSRQENELLNNCSEIEKFFKSTDIDWRQIQSKLSKNEIAIEFFNVQVDADAEEYYASIITSDCSTPLLEKICLSSDLATNKPEKSISSEVSELIWGPISKKVGSVSKIYFSPEGILNSYPIEYLSVPNNPRCEMYRLSSTREILSLGENSSNITSVALFGGMDFDSSESVTRDDSFKNVDDNLYGVTRGGFHFGNLAGTESEIKSIACILRRKNVNHSLYIGKDCTEESFINLSGMNTTIIHVATHGFYFAGKKRTSYLKSIGMIDPLVDGSDDSSISMDLSALMFSGGNNTLREYDKYEDKNNGILTATEASELSLDGTDLLVLSACQTALGEITKDGVIGIQRGFKLAGVKSMIISLWEVNDDATCLLMEEFYSYLTKYQDKHKAFSRAVADVRKFKGTRVIDGTPIKVDYSSPNYWAAFIMIDAI